MWILQGTLYPDVIESCPPPGSGRKHSHTIKSHHNVGGLPKDLKFQLVEPLRELFKVGSRVQGSSAIPRLGQVVGVMSTVLPSVSLRHCRPVSIIARGDVGRS